MGTGALIQPAGPQQLHCIGPSPYHPPIPRDIGSKKSSAPLQGAQGETELTKGKASISMSQSYALGPQAPSPQLVPGRNPSPAPHPDPVPRPWAPGPRGLLNASMRLCQPTRPLGPTEPSASSSAWQAAGSGSRGQGFAQGLTSAASSSCPSCTEAVAPLGPAWACESAQQHPGPSRTLGPGCHQRLRHKCPTALKLSCPKLVLS